MKEEIITEKEFDDIRASFSGSSPHIAGSFICKTIDEAFGLDKVMECIEFPERLLNEYNKAILKIESVDQTYYVFNKELVERIYRTNINSIK
jgi:hypothetical protein